MEGNIVCWPNVERYYGENSELVEKYKKIEKSGECPFCPEGLKKGGFSIVGETGCWYIVLSQYPYKNSEVHLLIIPKRHVTSLSDLTHTEWGQMAEVIIVVMAKYPFLTKGYGLAVRVGEVGGVTLCHLHWHLIVPQIVGTGPIAVNFGIG